jgi:hypothetical protein
MPAFIVFLLVVFLVGGCLLSAFAEREDREFRDRWFVY